MITNQLTEVRLLSVPLEKDYKHTFYFTSKEEQANYFIDCHQAYDGSQQLKMSEASYQRKEGYIRFSSHADLLQHCNYLMFKNPNHLDKWFYGFITHIEYKSDEVSWIFFELDVIQSYLFDYTVLPSFVEREHVASDVAGEHTVPEGLECGEFISTYDSNVSELLDISTVIGVSETLDLGINSKEKTERGNKYGGLFSGIHYYVFPSTATVKDLTKFIKAYDDGGKSDGISCIFTAPSFIAPEGSQGFIDNGNGLVDDQDLEVRHVLESSEPQSLDYVINKTITENPESYGHQIRNNKLKTFPFKYLLVSNNNGGAAIYKYEDFSEGEMTFKIYGVLTPGGSIRLIPCDYKKSGENNEEGLNLGKFPICNWTSDIYTNWLTQNSVNIGLNIASGVGQIIAGTAIAVGSAGLGTAVGGGSVVGGVSTIANQLAQIHQMSFTPPQSRGNTNCGDVITATNNNTFTFYAMTIRPEVARIIDGYFDMFGYKVNSVKIPESNHRESYWFTKTIDVTIHAEIPQNHLEKIKGCYNNGITFWKDTANIGDYSVSNLPLSDKE